MLAAASRLPSRLRWLWGALVAVTTALGCTPAPAVDADAGPTLCATVPSAPDVCFDEGSPCDEAQLVVLRAMNEVAAPYTSCGTDADCVAEPMRFLCGDGADFLIQSCAVAVASARRCDFRQALERIEADLCPTACVSTGCVVRLDCAPTVPHCVDGVCAAVLE